MSKKLSYDIILENRDAINNICIDLGNSFKADVSVKYNDYCPEQHFYTNVSVSDYGLYMTINIIFNEFEYKFFASYSSDYQIIKYTNPIITIKAKDRFNTNILITIIKK